MFLGISLLEELLQDAVHYKKIINELIKLITEDFYYKLLFTVKTDCRSPCSSVFYASSRSNSIQVAVDVQ